MTQIKAPALSPTLVQQAEFVRSVLSVSIPPGIPIESVLAPDFWAHCAGKLRPGTHIECSTQDNQWYAELRVAKVEKLAAHMLVLFYTDFTAQAKIEQPTQSGYKVAFGGAHKWRVIRLSDNAVIHHGEPTEEDAKKWLDAHIAEQV